MATYSFIVKKGKFRLELITTDKDLLTSQFELWVRQAGEYARQKKAKECKDIAESQIREEEKITQKNIENQTKAFSKPKPEETAEKPKEVVEEQKEKSQNNDLDIFYAPVTEDKTEEQERTIRQEEEKSAGVFDNILENNMKNPQTELSFKPSPSIKKDSAFINFISNQKIERKIDYLLYTAYYFSQFEQKPRFTLKQLNSKLMQNLAVIVDHSVLQEAINRDYLECLPDLTGVVGASEYRLTAYGEKNILEA